MIARLSDRARHDLDLIYAHIFATRGAAGADQFLELARQATEFIAKNPYAGPHPNWACGHQTLRFWVIGKTKFLIFYIPGEDAISIERVLDGRKDVVRILERGIELPPEHGE